jgi:hypothetical protein
LLVFIAWPIAGFCAGIWLVIQVSFFDIHGFLWNPFAIMMLTSCSFLFLKAVWSLLSLPQSSPKLSGEARHLASRNWSSRLELFGRLPCSFLNHSDRMGFHDRNSQFRRNLVYCDTVNGA